MERDPHSSLRSDWFNPHYRENPDFQGKIQAIFLASGFPKGTHKIPEASYRYSDQFSNQFEAAAQKAAWEKAEEGVESGLFELGSAAYYEAWLRALYQDPDLKLVHILAGVNSANGYPYQVYGFTRVRKIRNRTEKEVNYAI